MRIWIAVIAVIMVVGVALLSGCTSRKVQTDFSLYKSAEARTTAHASYDRVMDLWEQDYSEEWVDTTYGKIHVIVSGPADAKPIFLLPGLFGDATMWYANAGALSEEYRVHAVDLPVFGGKSEPNENRITDIAGYTELFLSLIDYFGYEKTALAGLSYGSWLSLALAREVPGHVGAVIMLDPSETFMKMSGIMAWKGFRYFMFFPNRNKYAEFLDWIGGGFSDSRSDIWVEHMLDVIEYGSVGMMDVPQHRVYAPEELTMVDMPVLIMAGGKPIIYASPEKFAEAAAKALPQAEIEVIADTAHSLHVEKYREVNEAMLEFLRSRYL